jgi:hypothetical protein
MRQLRQVNGFVRVSVMCSTDPPIPQSRIAVVDGRLAIHLQRVSRGAAAELIKSLMDGQIQHPSSLTT